MQNHVEIEGDINNRIQVGLFKWRRAWSLLCDQKVPCQAKRRILPYNYKTGDVVWDRVLGGKKPVRE